MSALTFAAKLKAIYPGLVSPDDFTLTANGADIATWTPRQHGLQRPTLAVVNAAYAALLQKRQVRTISAAEFIKRIPSATWAKVTAARQGTSALAVSLDQGITQLCASPVVVADDPQLVAMLTALVTVHVITDAERVQILGF